jgi:2-iminobutanoate/2-iminopropanoate deaminase
MSRDVFTTDALLKPTQPYSQGIISAGKQLWLSGILPFDPISGQLAAADFAIQTNQVLRNLKAAVESAGVSLERCIKVNVYLIDTKYHQQMNDIYQQYFQSPYPARTTIQTALRLSMIEIDAVVALE